MTAEWSLPAWAVLATLGLLVVALAAAVVVVRRAARAARAESARLQAQVDAIAARLGRDEAARPAAPTAAAAEEREYVITRLGRGVDVEDDTAQQAAPTVDRQLFADLVLREGVVQAASIAAGVRRALAPAHLNRVRFEMRREVRRARKQRRADLRQARREYETRQRADLDNGEFAA